MSGAEIAHLHEAAQDLTTFAFDKCIYYNTANENFLPMFKYGSAVPGWFDKMGQLDLAYTRLADSHVRDISDSCANLEALFLDNGACTLTDNALAHLGDMLNLTHLHLWGANVFSSAAYCRLFDKKSNIRQFSISRAPNFDGAAFEALIRRNYGLSVLSLYRVPLSEVALSELCSLEGLRMLYVNYVGTNHSNFVNNLHPDRQTVLQLAIVPMSVGSNVKTKFQDCLFFEVAEHKSMEHMQMLEQVERRLDVKETGLCCIR